ncbi:MAG TPA: PEP-CTERM sorting domain-containing protein [Candidatus Binatia bacterium]|nr:PEP-CTERM sorting domain-containing protein [Candidatus Binatia bacterium]
MTRCFRFSCAMFVLISLHCFADSVRNVNNVSASLIFFPNQGFGDNARGTLKGGGLNLTVLGGTPYWWFPGADGLAPGSSGGGSTTIYFDSVFGTIGKNSYDDSNLFIEAADFGAGVFTFPANGSDFAVSVQASIGLIVFQKCSDPGCTFCCNTLNVTTRPGILTMSYSFHNGLYYPDNASFVSSGTPVPEPSTLALFAIGLAGLPLHKFRKKHSRPTTT